MRRSVIHHCSHLAASLMGAWLALASSPAGATFSILAVNDEGWVGAAGISCVGGLDISPIFGIAPGRGGVLAQAYSNEEGRDFAVRGLMKDAEPSTVLANMTSPEFDRGANLRQYALVRRGGPALAYTGADNGPYARDLQGTLTEGTQYTIQGNLITGPEVLSAAGTAFAQPHACRLAGRLMAALEAGGTEGRGDARCIQQGRPGDSGFVRVVDADGRDVISIVSLKPEGGDPLAELKRSFEAWRASSNCAPSNPALPPSPKSPSLRSFCSIGNLEPASTWPTGVAWLAFGLVGHRWRRRSR